MTTEEVIQMRIRSLQREIGYLERIKAVMVNETERKEIDLHIENLRREIRRLEKMSVDKKTAMKRIIELTHSENWQEDKEIVAEVQKLGKPMWAEKTKRRTPRRIAIWHGDRILVTGTAEQLSEITGLSKNIIWDRARSLWIDSKGRQFRYVEEKKC